MEYRILGRTDIKVSLICLGTMTWGYQNTEAQAHEQIDYALSQGVNFLDTAELYAVPPSAETYGKTETIIGNWLAKTKKRDDVIIATKIAGPGPDWIRGRKNRIDPVNIRAAVEESLRRLKTDYIDLYQLHWPNRGSYHFSRYWTYNPVAVRREDELENFHAVLTTLDELIRAGKIRAIGLSNETAWGTMRYLDLARKHNLPRMVTIQNEYSLLNRNFEPDLAEIALCEDIGLLAWSPLATGMLSGKYENGKRPAGSRWSLDSRAPHRDTPQAHAAVTAYRELARKYGLDGCQMALAFVNHQPFVTANIIGATTMAQLRDNIDSINVTLSDEVLAEIGQIRRQYPVPF